MARRHGKRSQSAPACRTCSHAVHHDEDMALEQLASAFPVRWQCYQEEWEMWVDYGPVAGARIEAAWQAEMTSVSTGTADDEEQWEINFIAMVQVNVRSDRRRRIRRTLVTHS